MRFIVLALALAFSGCGKEDDKSEDSIEVKPSMLVQDAASLPSCDAASEGWVVYIKAESKLVACSASAWTDAPLGSPGSIIDKRWACNKSADIDQTAEIDLSSYLVMFVKFRSGDAFLSCSGLMTTTTGMVVPAAASVFFGPNDPASVNGVYLCPTPLLTTQFTLATGEAKYTNALDEAATKTEVCTNLP